MNQEEISSYLRSISSLGIPEQKLFLILDSYSIFKEHNGIYLIIANESYMCRGSNIGRLMAGLVKFKLLELDGKLYLERKLIIPFSSKLLLVNFLEDNKIEVIYMEGNTRKFKEIKLIDGVVPYQDYAFLIEDEYLDKKALNNTYLLELPLTLKRELKTKKD